MKVLQNIWLPLRYHLRRMCGTTKTMQKYLPAMRGCEKRRQCHPWKRNKESIHTAPQSYARNIVYKPACQSSRRTMLRWHRLFGCDAIISDVLSCHFSAQHVEAFRCDVMFAGSKRSCRIVLCCLLTLLSFLYIVSSKCAVMCAGYGFIAVWVHDMWHFSSKLPELYCAVCWLCCRSCILSNLSVLWCVLAMVSLLSEFMTCDTSVPQLT